MLWFSIHRHQKSWQTTHENQESRIPVPPQGTGGKQAHTTPSSRFLSVLPISKYTFRSERGSSLYYNDLKEKLNIFSLFLINRHTAHMHDPFTESYKHDTEHLRKLHEVTLRAMLKVESRFPYSLSHKQHLMFYLPNTSFLP